MVSGAGVRSRESGVGKAGVIAHQDHTLPSSAPAVVYSERLAARRAVVAEQSARLDTLSYARLASFLVGLVVAGLAFGTELFSPWFALLPVVVFLFLSRSSRWPVVGRPGPSGPRLSMRAASRVSKASPRAPGDGARFADEKHPYSADLDLFGPGSVFERLTACRTRIGEETLAAWLLAPANPDEVKERQQAVADLTPRLDLRESLAVAGANVPAADYHPLAEWGTASPEPAAHWKYWAIELLGWANVAAWIGWLFVGTTGLPVLIFGVASIALAAPLLSWSRRVLAPLERAEHNLSLLESVLARLERESFTAPRTARITGRDVGRWASCLGTDR